MKITVPVQPTVDIEVAEDISFKGLVDALASMPAVQNIARDLGGKSYYEAFEQYSYRDMDDSTALTLAHTYLRGGVEGFEEAAYSDDWESSPESYYFHNEKRDFIKALGEITGEVIEQLPQFEGLEDELAEALAEDLKDVYIEAMADADTSKPTDMIPSHADVEVAFVPDYDKVGGIDDLHTHHRDVCSEALTVRPDANFLRFLKLINMAPSEYVAAVKDTYEVDLTVPAFSENDSDYRREDKEQWALRWAAVLDVENGTSENISKLPLRGKYEIAEWNTCVDIINTIKDYDRPVAVKDKTLFDIMDNATYGGVGTLVCRLPLKDLLAGKFDKPFLATGGQIGIHNFCNGSGYLDTPDAPVLIDPSKGSFYIQSTRKNAVDDVYGMISRAYKIETEAYEASPWQRVKPDQWRRAAAEEGYVTITKGRDGDEDVYWVASHDTDGEPAGPRSTAEVFPSLESAKEEGDAIAAEPIRSAEAEMAP